MRVFKSQCFKKRENEIIETKLINFIRGNMELGAENFTYSGLVMQTIAKYYEL